MILYYFKGFSKNPSELNSDYFLRRAIEDYMVQMDIINDVPLTLLREDSGKPFLKDLPLSFSISHTDDLWACIVGSQNVGLDIQEKKECNFIAIANRYFSQDEIEYVKQFGKEGFYNIWVRKEAYIKFLGTTLGKGISKFSMVNDGKLLKSFGNVNFKNIDLKINVNCIYAVEHEEELWKQEII